MRRVAELGSLGGNERNFMKSKLFLTFAIFAVITITIGSIIFAKRPAAINPTPKILASSAHVQSQTPAVRTDVEIAPAPEVLVPEKLQEVAALPSKSDLQPKPQISAKPAKQKAPIQDPDARVALSFVGADPDAEQYWAAAINNPNLPAEERKDLIEDLNEDGLSDPKTPGPQDLPLIMSRIVLIEELAPYAMDQVNADAFAEAYKDLTNMLAGKPVD